MFAGQNDRRTGFERRSGGDRRKGDRRKTDLPALELQEREPKKGSQGSMDRVGPVRKDLAVVWNHKGKDFVEREEYEEARKAFLLAVEIRPQLAEAWYNLADLCAFMGEKEEALLSLRKATELDPLYKEKAGLSDNFKGLKENGDFNKLLR